MPCYTHSFYKTDTPLLRSVPRAYILTMAHSKRLDNYRRACLCQLARTTIVQYNHRGATDCKKPPCTEKSNFDLVHAYKAACEHSMCIGDCPVLFFEDDAILRSDARKEEFECIDDFIRQNTFDVYTLGSYGISYPLFWCTRHYAMWSTFCAQATIWSFDTRRSLLAMETSKVPHVDAHFLSKRSLKYKFERPLILQTFPKTENAESWCMYCGNGTLRHVDKRALQAWRWFLHYLDLDRSALPGWDVLDALSNVSFAIIIAMLLVCVHLLLRKAGL